MKISKRCIILIGLLLFAAAVFSGCSHKVLVAPEPPRKMTPVIIPLDVGLYITEDFKNFKVSEKKWGDTWNYPNLGQASAAQFQLALSKTFQTVKLVDGKPPFPSEKSITVHAVVEPAIERFDFDIPFTKFQVYPARINYRITAYGGNGNIILKETVEGIGDTKGHAGFDFSENPSTSASKAVQDGVQKAMKVILNSAIITSNKLNLHKPDASQEKKQPKKSQKQISILNVTVDPTVKGWSTSDVSKATIYLQLKELHTGEKVNAKKEKIGSAPLTINNFQPGLYLIEVEGFTGNGYDLNTYKNLIRISPKKSVSIKVHMAIDQKSAAKVSTEPIKDQNKQNQDFKEIQTIQEENKDDVKAKLLKLKDLLNSGLITKDDYDKKKSELLESL